MVNGRRQIGVYFLAVAYVGVNFRGVRVYPPRLAEGRAPGEAGTARLRTARRGGRPRGAGAREAAGRKAGAAAERQPETASADRTRPIAIRHGKNGGGRPYPRNDNTRD
jgi:hypothetical protein